MRPRLSVEDPLRKTLIGAGPLTLFALSILTISIGCASKQGSEEVAATVGGRKIYRADIEKYYQNQTSGSDQQPVGEQATSLRLSILRELIDNEILMRRAEKLGLRATDQDVERKLKEIRSPYPKKESHAPLSDKTTTRDPLKRDPR